MMRSCMKLLTLTTATLVACIHPLLTRSAQADIVLPAGTVNPAETQADLSSSRRVQTSDPTYLQATNLATIAISGCYDSGRLEDCAKLNRIKMTLISWCQQSNDINSNACVTYKNVLAYEKVAIAAQAQRMIIIP